MWSEDGDSGIDDRENNFMTVGGMFGFVTCDCVMENSLPSIGRNGNFILNPKFGK